MSKAFTILASLLVVGSAAAQWSASNPPPARVPLSVPEPFRPPAPVVPDLLAPAAVSSAPPSAVRLPVTPVMPQDLAGRGRRPLPATVMPTQQWQTVQPPAPPATSPTNAASGARVWMVGAGPGSDFRTIQQAAEVAQAGDTVLVQAGQHGGFRTRRSGREGAPISFQGQPGALINISGNHPADHILVRHDWIVISGFAVRDAPRAGIGVIDASDVVVSNNVVGPNGVWGIFTGFTPRIRIVDNKAFGSRKEHGIYVSNSRVREDRPVLRGNECYANAASGIQLNGDCLAGGDGILEEALIENNILHDNDSKALSLISVADSVIQNNLIYQNGRKSGAAGIHLTDELGCGKASRRNLVVNNTIVEARIAGIRLTDQASDNILFNNLLVGRGIVDEVGSNQLDQRSNVVQADAVHVFLDPARGDFRLLPLRAALLGTAEFGGRSAPRQDISGAPRPGLVPAVGAFDQQGRPLPAPGRYDPQSELLWNPTPLGVP